PTMMRMKGISQANNPARWELVVSTRFRAPIEDVWRLKTDPLALADEFVPMRLSVRDPAALGRALRGDDPPSTFVCRFGGPLGLLTVAWPIVVVESVPMDHYQDGSENALVRTIQHRHRFEAEGPVVR